MRTTLFILFQHIVPQQLLSRLAGKLAECRWPPLKNLLISRFIRHFQVNMQEAEQTDPTQFPCFNDFFTRALKPGLRPFSQQVGAIGSPADGAISQIGKIDEGRLLQAKGRSYGLTTLLGGDTKLAEQFIGGEFTTIYLSPKDYHRVHMPISGTLRETLYIPGDLFSVNQATAGAVDQLFARNERLVAIFDTEHGPMAMILVGAMIVAGIETVWSGQVAPQTRKVKREKYSTAETPIQPIHLQQGDEMGRFKLGSTVILLFAENQISWLESLAAESPLTLGQQIGQAVSTKTTAL